MFDYNREDSDFSLSRCVTTVAPSSPPVVKFTANDDMPTLHHSTVRPTNNRLRTISTMSYLPNISPIALSKKRPQRRPKMRIDLSHNEFARALLSGSKSEIRQILLRIPDENRGEFLSRELEPLFKKPYLNCFYALCTYAPDIAKEQLELCLNSSGTCEDGTHKFDYSFLDNIYIPETEDEEDKGKEPQSFYPKKPGQVKRFTSNFNALEDKHCLSFMAKHGQESLIRHPIVCAMLNSKWEIYRWRFFVGLLAWLIFIGCLVAIISLQNHPLVLQGDIKEAKGNGECVFDNTSINLNCCNAWDNLYKKWEYNNRIADVFQAIVSAIIALHFLDQLYLLVLHRQYYFLNLEHIITTITNGLVIFLLLDFDTVEPPIGCKGEIHMHTKWSWEVSVFGVAMAWVNLLFYIRKMQHSGLYVIMFMNLVIKFAAFSMVMLICLGAFGSVFLMLYQQQCPFQNYLWSTLSSVVMMVGEYSYQGLVCSSGKQAELHSIELIWIAYAAIIFIMYMVVLNMLIGLAVNDIKNTQSKAEFQRLKLQASVILDYELSLPFCLLKRFLKFEDTVSCKELGCRERKTEMLMESTQVGDDLKQIKNKLDELSGQTLITNAALSTFQRRLDDICDKVDALYRRSIAEGSETGSATVDGDVYTGQI